MTNLHSAIRAEVLSILREVGILPANHQGVAPLDPVREFLATLPPGEVGALALYESYRKWATDAGIEPVTMTAFGRAAVRCHGQVSRRRKGTVRVYTVLTAEG